MDKLFTSLLLGLFFVTGQLYAQTTPTFTISPQSSSAQIDDIIEVDITVSDFDDILSTQYAVKWDASIFEFVDVLNVNTAEFPQLDAGISDPTAPAVPAGQVEVSWFDGSFAGVSVSDGTVVFTVQLRAIDCGDSDIFFADANQDISIEVISSSTFTEIGLIPENGTATVGGTGCGNQTPDVVFTIDDASVQSGTSFCLDVSVEDFTNLTDVQLSINYNGSMLNLTSISNLNLAGLSQADFNTSTNGQITMDWSNATATSVGDGTAVFELCFQALLVGNSQVSFSDTPLPVSITDGMGMDVDFDGNNGTVNITPINPPGGDLLIDIEGINVDEGDDFCVSVTADNFTDVVGMAFTLNYNASQLSFTQATNLNPNIPGFTPGNIANPQPGFITVNYFENNLSPTDLPDGTVLFDICFTAISDGTSSIEMTSDITLIEFSDSNQDVIPSDSDAGTIIVNNTIIGTDLLIDIGDASVDQGDDFCVSVTADNFTDVVGMAFTLNYDASQLSFNQATNLNSNIPGFTTGNIANPQPGFITVNYFENNLSPTDLPNGSVLFDICFTATSGGTSAIEMTSDITIVEFSDGDQNVIPADSDPGSIEVMGPVGNPDLLIDIENTTVTDGDDFCVSVTTDNFTDVVGMAFTLSFNSSLLSFTQATNLNPSIPGFTTGNIANPQPGFVTVNYFENNLNPTDLANGSVLFDVCFTATAEGVASIAMTSDITQIEFSDSNQEIIPSDDDPGIITIEENFMPTDLFLTIEDMTVDPGENFCLDVTTLNFEDVVGMAFTMTYDVNQLEFVEITNYNANLTGFGPGNVANPQPGFITVNYFENNLDPTDLPDNSLLFQLCFTVIGSGSDSDIDITSDITQIEFSDSQQAVIPFSYEEGTVDITGPFLGLRLTAEDITTSSSDPFCMEVTVENFEDIVGMAFTMNYDDTHLQFQQVTNFNANLPGFTSGNVANPQSGFITVNYFENNLIPTTLSDDEVLFEVCFLPIGPDGSCSDVTFTSDITQIEFSDSNQEVIPFFSEEGTICLDDATPGVIGLNIGNANVDLGQTFCLPVTTDNFVDVATMEFTMVYDASELSLLSVTNVNGSFSGFTINNSFDTSTPGIVTVEWSGTSGVTLPDNTTLFELCFEAIGTPGQSSDVDINSSVIPINFQDSNDDPLTLDKEEGTVTINPLTTDLLVIAGDETVEPDENFCIPISVLNFTDVLGFGFTVNYDDTQLMFTQVQNLTSNLDGFVFGNNIANPQPGFITVNYFNNNLDCTDLPNGEILFEACFTAIGDDGDMSDIEFTSDITPFEFVDCNEDVIPNTDGQNGKVTISDILPPEIVDIDAENIACFGESTGSVTVAVEGGTGGPYTYDWEGPGNYTGSTASIDGLAQGTYFLTVTDVNSNLTVTASTTIFAPSSDIDIAGGVTPPTCQGGCNGTVFVNVSGGTPPYTYDWGTNDPPTTTSLNNLCAGPITVTVTDNNGCTKTRTFSVPNGTGSPINIDSNVTPVTCNGDNDGAIALIISGFTGGVTYLWCEGLNGSAPTNLFGGDYCVTVIDNVGCNSSTTITVPEPDPIELDTEVTEVACRGEATGAITVSASGGNGGFSYDWSPGNIGPGPTVSGLTAGTYTVTASDSEGCFIEETYNVTETPLPFEVTGTAVTPIDLGNDGSITLDLAGGDPPYNVEWTTPTNQMVNSQNLINLNEPGDYCFVAMDERGCTITGCVEVLRTLRISDFVITDACFGEDNGSVSIVMEGGKEPYTYAWTPAVSTGPAIPNQGAGTVSVLVTDVDGETLTAEFDIGETTPIDINPSLIPVTVNAGNTNGSISLNASGGVNPVTFLWDNGATTSEITNLGTGTYCVTITDSNFNNNCTFDTCFNMFFSDPLGPPSITAVSTTCSYTDDGAIIINIPGGVAPFTITLTPTDGSTPIVMGPLTDSSITQDGLAAGDYDVEIVDQLGQTQNVDNITVGAAVAITSMPADYLNSLASTCDGSIQLQVAGGTPPLSVVWSNGGGNGPNPSGLCGNTEYTPTITDGNGCELVGEPVFISAFDVTVASTTQTDCPDDANGTADLDVTGGDPAYQYIWMNSSGQVIADIEDVENLPVGTYTVTVIEGSGREIMQTIVIGTMSNLAVDASVVTNFNSFGVSCANAANGIAQAEATGSSGYLYEWTRLSDNTLVSAQATANELTAGAYQLNVFDEFGCSTTRTVNLTAPPALSLLATVKGVACFDSGNGAIQVAASGGAAAGSYSYTWSDGTFGNQLVNASAGTYSVTVQDINLCQTDSTFVLDNPEPISVSFEMEPATDGCNGTLTAVVEGGTAPYEYNWMNIEGAIGATATDLCPTINSTSEYLLQVVDDNGCLSALTPTDVDDKRFPCLEERVVITPDGNGSNDEFIIFCVNDYPENSLEIYNRWGGLVFQAQNYDNTWEGTDGDGNILPEGPYYYILEYVDPEGNTLQQKGSMTILRDE